MSAEAEGRELFKLSFYCGERDFGSRRPSDGALDLFERHRLRFGALFRGAEGFGAGALLRADSLLSLSEDLPSLAVGFGSREQVERTAEETAALAGSGLLALERVRLASAGDLAGGDPGEEVKVTVYTGRRARRNGKPEHVATIAALHRHGVAAATSLLGVDGIVAERRFRARVFSANSWVPMAIVAVGERGRVAAALTELEAVGDPPPATIEPVRIRPRGDATAALPPGAADTGAGERWTKLSVYCSERSQHDGHTLHQELVRRLRAAGAAGATVLRGVWGYHGEELPHGDKPFALRRRAPVLIEAIDTEERGLEWLGITDELTAEAGLVTVQAVAAVRAVGSSA